MPMALSVNSGHGSFPSNSNVSATFSFWIHSGKFWNPTNCEKFNADGSLMGRTNLDKSVWQQQRSELTHCKGIFFAQCRTVLGVATGFFWRV